MNIVYIKYFINLRRRLNIDRIQPFLCTLVGPLNILLATRFLSYYDSSLFLLSKFVILKIACRYISSTSLNGLELRPFLSKYNDSKKKRFLSTFYKVIASNLYFSSSMYSKSKCSSSGILFKPSLKYTNPFSEYKLRI